MFSHIIQKNHKGGFILEKIVLYSLEEIAEVLKVTQRTLYNYIKGGQLKAVKIGKHWRVRHEHLMDFINNGTEE